MTILGELELCDCGHVLRRVKNRNDSIQCSNPGCGVFWVRVIDPSFEADYHLEGGLIE